MAGAAVRPDRRGPRPRNDAAVIDDAPVRAPEFALTAVAGGSVSLAELVADGPALLVFVAEECPTSAMTLRRLAEPAKLLHRAGVSVAAVFEDPRRGRRSHGAAGGLRRDRAVGAEPVRRCRRPTSCRACPRRCVVDRAGRQVPARGRLGSRRARRRARGGRAAGRRSAACRSPTSSRCASRAARPRTPMTPRRWRCSTPPGPTTSSRRCSSAAGATGCR